MKKKSIRHYEIRDELGRGGMGIVYRARDTRLDRDVAIKFLPPHVASNPDERRRFEVEAKAAASLSHSNIMTIHAIEDVDDEVCIVMEYVDGVELKDHIGEKPLPVDDALRFARQIARGLEAAHAKGIVHRDIKSRNIMITRSGDAKVMDFGLAHRVERRDASRILAGRGSTACSRAATPRRGTSFSNATRCSAKPKKRSTCSKRWRRSETRVSPISTSSYRSIRFATIRVFAPFSTRWECLHRN